MKKDQVKDSLKAKAGMQYKLVDQESPLAYTFIPTQRYILVARTHMLLWLAEKPTQQAAWGHRLVIPALKRLRHKNYYKFQDSQVYIVILCLKTAKKIKSTTNNSAMDKVKEEDPGPNN